MKKLLMIIPLMLICSLAWADLNYPHDATTDMDKLEYAYIAQETMRLEHNEMGQKYKDGIITKGEWMNYLNKEYEPRSSNAITEVIKHKEKMKSSERWEVNVGDIPKTTSIVSG